MTEIQPYPPAKQVIGCMREGEVITDPLVEIKIAASRKRQVTNDVP